MTQIKKYRHLIALTLCVFSLVVMAQNGVSDTEVNEQHPDQLPEQAVSVSRNDNTDNGNTDSNNQVFIPSEEISEDAPVAFPVDI